MKLLKRSILAAALKLSVVFSLTAAAHARTPDIENDYEPTFLRTPDIENDEQPPLLRTPGAISADHSPLLAVRLIAQMAATSPHHPAGPVMRTPEIENEGQKFVRTPEIKSQDPI